MSSCPRIGLRAGVGSRTSSDILHQTDLDLEGDPFSYDYLQSSRPRTVLTGSRERSRMDGRAYVSSSRGAYPTVESGPHETPNDRRSVAFFRFMKYRCSLQCAFPPPYPTIKLKFISHALRPRAKLHVYHMLCGKHGSSSIAAREVEERSEFVLRSKNKRRDISRCLIVEELP